jgi:hypothetical protein
VTEDTCLVCGSLAEAAVAHYAARIANRACVVCGTDLSNEPNLFADADLAAKQVQTAAATLTAVDVELETAQRMMREAEDAFQEQLSQLQALTTQIAERSHLIDSLVKRLPPAEGDIHRQRTELASMRSRVEQLREELTTKRRTFQTYVEELTRQLAVQSQAVKKSFDAYAEGFLIEICRLIWSPQRARLGQTGDLIEFPAFELEMTGTNFETPIRRSGPGQVSESQREFIDLAFRMSLIAIAGANGQGTLVMDAPESSLDAVFVSRATTVLSRFATQNQGNRLLITSNLVEGKLIPTLIQHAIPDRDKAARIVDLFEVAAPTAAVRKLRAEYELVRKQILGTSEVLGG